VNADQFLDPRLNDNLNGQLAESVAENQVSTRDEDCGGCVVPFYKQYCCSIGCGQCYDALCDNGHCSISRKSFHFYSPTMSYLIVTLSHLAVAALLSSVGNATKERSRLTTRRENWFNSLISPSPLQTLNQLEAET